MAPRRTMAGDIAPIRGGRPEQYFRRRRFRRLLFFTSRLLLVRRVMEINFHCSTSP